MSKPLPAHITYEKKYTLDFIIDNSMILLQHQETFSLNFYRKLQEIVYWLIWIFWNSLDISTKETENQTSYGTFCLHVISYVLII